MSINDNVIDIRNAQYLNRGHYVVETKRLMGRGKNYTCNWKDWNRNNIPV